MYHLRQRRKPGKVKMPLADLHIPRALLSAHVSDGLSVYLLPQQPVPVIRPSYTPRLGWHRLRVSLSQSSSPFRVAGLLETWRCHFPRKIKSPSSDLLGHLSHTLLTEGFMDSLYRKIDIAVSIRWILKSAILLSWAWKSQWSFFPLFEKGKYVVTDSPNGHSEWHVCLQ